MNRHAGKTTAATDKPGDFTTTTRVISICLLAIGNLFWSCVSLLEDEPSPPGDHDVLARA